MKNILTFIYYFLFSLCFYPKATIKMAKNVIFNKWTYLNFEKAYFLTLVVLRGTFIIKTSKIVFKPH